MQRLTDNSYAVAISYALDCMGPALASRLHGAHYFTGTDPLYAGVHRYELTHDGRSYRRTACCVYGSEGVPDQRTTIVLPTAMDAEPGVVVHELGHVLHELIGLEYEAVPCTPYAATNGHEAFAEAFTAWMGCYANDGRGVRPAAADVALFDSLLVLG